MKRKLDKNFMDDLLTGQLSDLLHYVKQDNTLILEIRDNYLNVYYRGGMILRVTRYKRGNSYKFEWNKKYAPDNNSLHLKLMEMKKVSDVNTCKKWIILMPKLVEHMDGWFNKHPKKEKIIQQKLVQSNVFNNYLITDFEYQKENKARFDFMGIKLNDDNSLLSFIELKQGFNSLRTRLNKNKKQTSGLKKHLEDIIDEIINEDDINNEIYQAESLFKQKLKLGLIPKGSFPNNICNDQIEILFIISDYKTLGSSRFSSLLQSEINEIQSFLKLKKSKIKLHINIMFLKTEMPYRTIKILENSKIEKYTNYKVLLNEFYS